MRLSAPTRLLCIAPTLAALLVLMPRATDAATSGSSRPLDAQQAPAPAAPPEAEPPRAGQMPPGSNASNNVRVSVTITDQAGKEAPVAKTVSMIIADGRQGSVRSMSQVLVGMLLVPLELNVDAKASITDDRRILLELKFSYGVVVRAELPASAVPAGASPIPVEGQPRGVSEISENLWLFLSPNTRVTASESADATSDRKVKVEVSADILK